MDKQLDLAVLGECLIELSSKESLDTTQSFQKSYGGDSIVSAIIASRLGTKTGLISGFGEDGFKDYLVSELLKENIDLTAVKTVSEQNGLYIASRNSDKNEFYYYKRKSAATRLEEDDVKEELISSLKCLYSTGVTQSLSVSARNAVKKAFSIAHENSVITAYDPNYTSCFMYSEETREFLEDILPFTKIIFMSLKNDAKHIFETDTPENLAKFLNDNGVEIVVIKSHVDGGYYTFYNGEKRFCEFFNDVEIVDITASGDTFNGAFLHAYISGNTPFEATKFASIAAGLHANKVGAVEAIPTKNDIMRYV